MYYTYLKTLLRFAYCFKDKCLLFNEEFNNFSDLKFISYYIIYYCTFYVYHIIKICTIKINISTFIYLLDNLILYIYIYRLKYKHRNTVTIFTSN